MNLSSKASRQIWQPNSLSCNGVGIDLTVVSDRGEEQMDSSINGDHGHVGNKGGKQQMSIAQNGDRWRHTYNVFSG